MTGLRGAGKSVLYESVIGKVGNGYVPRGPSPDVEAHRTFIKSKRSKIRAQTVVLPGQESAERAQALARLLGQGNYPTGVIHVTCWGYNSVWEAGDRRAVSDQITAEGKEVDLQSIHEWNLREELADFEETCKLLKDAWGRRSKVWADNSRNKM